MARTLSPPEWTFLRSVDASSSTNLTTWHFSGDEDEQSKVVGTTRGDMRACVVHNVRHRTHIRHPRQIFVRGAKSAKSDAISPVHERVTGYLCAGIHHKQLRQSLECCKSP